MLFYEETYDLPAKYPVKYLPVIILVLIFLGWNVLVPFYAIVFAGTATVAGIFAYRFRSAKVRVTREEIQFEGGTKFIPIPVPLVKQIFLAERGPNAVFTQNEATPRTIRKFVTLPMSIPTYFFIHKGVLIERGDPSPLPWVFIPSTDPERLLKAIQDTKRF